MLLRYGLGPYYMDGVVNTLLTKFETIYDAQRNCKSRRAKVCVCVCVCVEYGVQLRACTILPLLVLMSVCLSHVAQHIDTSFATVEEMLEYMDLFEYTQRDLKTFLEEQGISGTFMDELVAGIMRTNYGQVL